MGATATVKGGLFESVGLTELTQIQGTGSVRRRARQLLSSKGMKAMRALMFELNGVVPGASAESSYGRVAASEELGGKRVIESEVFIDRNTTADDVTEIGNDFLVPMYYGTYGSTPVVNKDGNPLGTR